MNRAREAARRRYADALPASMANAAHNVRAGYENVWITAGIDALVPYVLRSGDGEDDHPEDERA